MHSNLSIRDGDAAELARLGQLLVKVYAALPGFPKPGEQPAYYDLLANIARFADKPGARVLVALSGEGEVVGGVVYFADMAHYGSGGTATTLKNASGIRLLGVDPECRGKGVGKALTLACIELARQGAHAEVILHTTKAMPEAWAMYERLGFVRSEELDFLQQEMTVFGFRLKLTDGAAAVR
ncbi:GNAT family N-acetyltransferase [Burkholderia sp. SRS-W-2-2016]|uniref:GNAT family N-acetyltransferase n=1 Tax=Burkholderia sp. SRS-W-2-2016 TaxID=1926878 RepID=UPI00094B4D61|nr:GNAT family N-acetyltransferase [Burkholderia sp. SRS-W-2-2016]OLL32401.1 GNAT family N-acetyltransferase [Burkholderia sp. SRS-W-2-2016]